MLKLMIAEDEALERNALRFLIEKFYKNEVQIVCEAVNGADAVEKALVNKPDIILMDISMPLMDGLKASSLIKKELENTEFIILTAYGQFEYAKEAIKLGINDYLLKPVTNEEFCDSIAQLIEKINKRNEETSRLNELKLQQNKLIPFLEKEIIIKSIYGVELPQKEYKEYLKMLDINSKYFRFLIFKANNIEKFNMTLLNIIKNKLKFKYAYVLGGIYTNELIYIIFDDQHINNNEMVNNIIKEINNNIIDTYKMELSIGIGKVYDDFTKFHNAYNETKNIITTNMNESVTLYSYQKEQLIFEKIINADLNSAIIVFEEIFNSLINTKETIELDIIKKKLKEFLLILNRNIIYFWGDEFNTFSLSKVEKDLDNMNDMIRISNYIKSIIKDTILTISNYKKDKSVTIIEEVKSFINENYMKNISLEEIAYSIELSPYYLSKLFKKVEKTNFKDYLIKVRMEEAKIMLRQDNKSIKEVAYAVGYQDPNYFSRAFKKYVGKSATYYSKLTKN